MAETKTNLDKWLYLVRRIEEHREEDAVKKLKKLYKSLIKDLRKSMGDVYADHADPETGALSYAELHRLGLDARLLEEVASRMNDVTQEEKRIITETVEQTYSNCYSGMVQAVEKAVDDDELRATFSTVEAVKPEVLRAAVNNPVHGLTLSDQLEKNRADIIYSIKQAVGVGLSQGDRYDTMARRIQQTLIGPDGAGGSYYKAVRIARTEAHRVREEGNLDAAQNLTEQLEPAGITMVKTWHTMKDERVRPNRARKTKGGWKYSKGGKYDHVSMEGVQVGINEEFKLPSGATTQAPGKSGVAGEDINCRCFLSYDVVKNTTVQPAPSEKSVRQDTDIEFDFRNEERYAQSKELIIQLSNEYNTRLQKVTSGAKNAAGDTDISGATMRLSSREPSTAIHEFAHTLANTDADKYGLTNDQEFWGEIRKIRTDYRKAIRDDSRGIISTYADSDHDLNEFMAEAFTHAKMRQMGLDIPSKYGTDFTYSQRVLDTVDKYFKKRGVAEFRIKNHIPGQDNRETRKRVMNVITKMPKKVSDAIITCDTIEIGKPGPSQYDYLHDIMYISKGAPPNEIIHEIGHLVENKLCNGDDILALKKQVLKKYKKSDCVKEDWFDTDGNPTQILRIDDPSIFVTPYQGRIYARSMDDAFGDDGYIKPEYLMEFFSEPFREYMENPEALKEKFPNWYNLVEAVVK